jgi:prepilin-type N-terminal cleavage/methylation domain-containing protein/prepilin-type processing-associated H-X9-DG protein
MRPTGFTLVELLVVMALMCIMYVMLYSPGAKYYQQRQKAACARNLQLIHVALNIYAAENRGRFPVVPGAATSEPPLSLLTPRCTADTAPFICPGTKDKRLPAAEPFASRRISYAYYMGRQARDDATAPLMSDRQVDTRTKAQSELLFSPDARPPGNNHRQFGGNILFCDGHVETCDTHAPRELPASPPVLLLNPRE